MEIGYEGGVGIWGAIAYANYDMRIGSCASNKQYFEWGTNDNTTALQTTMGTQQDTTASPVYPITSEDVEIWEIELYVYITYRGV